MKIERARQGLIRGVVCVKRQEAILRELIDDDHPRSAATAKIVLSTLRDTLRLARVYLEQVARWPEI